MVNKKVTKKATDAKKATTGKNVVSVVALLTTVAALSFLYFSIEGLPPRLEARPHEALGQALAREAAKLLGPGGRITIISRDTALFQNPATDAQLKGFHRTAQSAKVPVAGIKAIKIDPLRVASVPPGEFFDVLRKAAEGDVIVSLLGPPVLSEEQAALLDDKRPRVIAVCASALPARINLKSLFDQKLLDAAVISRPEPQPGGGKGESLEQTFDRWFVLITAANLSELPPATASRR